MEPLPYQRGDRPGRARRDASEGDGGSGLSQEVANIHISLTGAEEHERQDSRPAVQF